jgi:hypothetical protein
MPDSIGRIGTLFATLVLTAGWSVAVAQHSIAPPRTDERPRTSRVHVPAFGFDSFRQAIDDLVFNQRIAGTFLGELVAEGEQESFFHFVLTLHADGTAEAGDSGDNLLGFESPSFGVWRRTGPLQVTIRQVYLRYSRAGNLTLFGRDTLVVDFDRRMQSATGTATGEALSPQEVLDSLDPNGGEATVSSTTNLRMTRLEVDVPWGSTDGNDVPEVATPIDCPSFTTTDAAIESFDDVDFYVIEGHPGESVQIDIDTIPEESTLDTILGVFDSDLLGIVASDDDAAPGEPNSFDSYVATTFPADGVLYIAVAPFVFPYQFRGPGYSFGSYTMNVECGAPVFATASAGGTVTQPEVKIKVPETRKNPRAAKPQARFRDRYTPPPPTAAESFGRARKMAGTYLAVETGYFGTLYEIITLHMDGTFSVQFEGSQGTSAESVRGDCRRSGPFLLICEGMDRLISNLGYTVLFDRISWVFDFDPALDQPRGYQVGQEIFRTPAMLNPPRPNLSVDDDDFVAFGFGNEIPAFKKIETAVAPTETRHWLGNLAFGTRIAGTYLGVVSENGLPPGEFFLARLGADGSFVASDTSDYLYAQIDGAVRGAWERTGPARVKARSIGFAAGGDIVRNTLVVEFSEDGLQASGSLKREFFSRLQVLDPLDPNTEVPAGEVRSLRFSMKRLVVSEEPAGE